LRPDIKKPLAAWEYFRFFLDFFQESLILSP
jgi:hypothetical protein